MPKIDPFPTVEIPKIELDETKIGSTFGNLTLKFKSKDGTKVIEPTDIQDPVMKLYSPSLLGIMNAVNDPNISIPKKQLENPNFIMSELEMLRGGISYSLDTIIEYKKEAKIESKDLYFLIGSDTLKTFHSWNKPNQILKECQLIVAIRPGFRPSDIDTKILSSIQFANIPRIEISSSQIRRRWKEGKTIRYMVTQQVWEYINDNKLYN